MTYPVTPDPSIHNEPTQVAADQKAQTAQQLRAMFAQLPLRIIERVVNAILTGLGLGSWTAGVDAGLEAISNTLQQWGQKLSTIGQDTTNLINDTLAAFGLSQTGNAADLSNAFQKLMSDLFGSGAVVGETTTNIQHSALPSTFSNLGTDLSNLFQDVVFGDGRGWGDLPTDLQYLVDDLIGVGHTVSITAPSQIPTTAVASTTSNANLGDDVTSAQGSASSAGSVAASASDAAAQAVSQINQVLNPTLPAAPTGLKAVGAIETGIAGIGSWLTSVFYKVTAVNAAGESAPSGEVYVWIALPLPTQATLTWKSVSGATSYNVYRGTSSGGESEYLNVGNVTTFVDQG